VGKRAQNDDEMQTEATTAAIAAARSVAQGQPANTPAGRLSDQQWGWIVTAAIFGWIQARYQQAIALGFDKEPHVTRMSPNPCDGAIVLSVLPKLADEAGIDWSKPVAEWSREEMASFVGLAWCLIDEAKAVLNRTSTGILQRPANDLSDPIPF
jgi:hypothetical protein